MILQVNEIYKIIYIHIYYAFFIILVGGTDEKKKGDLKIKAQLNDHTPLPL